MLEYIRERAQGWIAWIIVGFLVLTFAIWGIQEFRSGDKKVNVATVNGKDISPGDFQREYQQQIARLQSMLGPNFDPNMINKDRMKKDVLEGMIDREVLTQAAQHEGLRISDRQLSGEIHSVQAFQTDGKFDPQLYENLLSQQRLTASQFEERARAEIMVEQLRRGMMTTAFATGKEADNVIRLRDQKRDIGYAIIAAAPFAARVTASEDEIKRYYDDNRSRYETPEQASVEYVELSLAQIAAQIQVGEDEIRKYYDEHANDFMVAEQRRARHILIPVEAGAKEDAVKAAQTRAEEVLQRLRKGESFEALAKQYSGDPGSAQKGGDLGYFGKGLMDPAFEKAAFALKPGELSAPVKSTFGFHIIRVDSIKTGDRKPFVEVKAKIAADLQREKAEGRFYDESERLTNAAFEHPDSLAEAAKAIGQAAKVTPLFTRDAGVGVAAHPKVRAAAFDEELMRKGTNSEPIEVGANDVVVLRVKEHLPAKVRPLDDVKADVKAQLQRELARKKAQETGKDIVARLKQGQDVVALVKAQGTEWKRPGLLGRSDPVVVPPVLAGAFRVVRPQEGKPGFDGVELPSGDYAIVGVYRVQDGDAKGADAESRKSAQETVMRSNAELQLRNYVDELKRQAKIERHTENL